MTTDELKSVQKALISFNKRAERATEASLVQTFVDSEPLFDLLSTTNNQVIYGRRGTGKTHALRYLAESAGKGGDHIVFLDLRSVGSNGSIYSDSSRTLAERASTLLLDVLGGLTNELYSVALDILDGHPNSGEVARRVDALNAAVSTVTITGSTQTEDIKRDEIRSAAAIDAKLGTIPASFSLAGKSSHDNASVHERKTIRSGSERIYLNFGNIASALADMIAILGGRRLWLLIDEWAEVPVDLQPYLADLLRRVILPINEITVKIAAIEHRSDFAIIKERGEYIGLELGSDVSADLNLDDFLVFDNSQDKSTDFVGKLIYRHYGGEVDESRPQFSTPDELISTIFTQYQVFQEFVRAVEGVPRDALNLIAKVATKAFGQQIAMNHVRSGARDWYNQDKAAVIRSNPQLNGLMSYVIDHVIAERRARAFLFPANIREAGIEKLFDARLLHILKKNVSSHDEPGNRYDVYKIDYGCYVDLINTSRAPEGLFEADDGGFIEVPRDDYRSIRRAILNPTDIAQWDAEIQTASA